jgi:hypothetical protein
MVMVWFGDNFLLSLYMLFQKKSAKSLVAAPTVELAMVRTSANLLYWSLFF